MAQILLHPAWQVFDANGTPLPGAQLFSYAAGTSTPLALYADSALTVPLPNPVIADSAGRFPALYGSPVNYRLDLFTASNSLVWTRDPVPVSNVIGPSLFAALDSVYVRIDRANADWLSLGGGTMTGLLTLSGNAVAPLAAVPLQQLQAIALPVNRQEFLVSGTWTKPAGYSPNCPVLIQCWGGGGSGRRDSNIANAGGGGGGGFVERWVPLGNLGATETVTIGAGGAAKTGSNADGDVGGTTSFGAQISAFGGGGGSTGRGGGGGYCSAGTTGTADTTGGHGRPGLPRYMAESGTFAGSGSYYDGFTAFPAQPGDRHGGGGGATAIAALQPGASSVYGGGGGGGGANGAAGGTSLFGGAGGAAGVTGVAGSLLGGGGGGGSTTSGAGGNGFCRVYVFPIPT